MSKKQAKILFCDCLAARILASQSKFNQNQTGQENYQTLWRKCSTLWTCWQSTEKEKLMT